MKQFAELQRYLSKLPAWLFTILTLILILWLTLAPKPLGDNSPKLFPGADTVVHGLMFGFFTLMMLFDWQRRHYWRKTRWLRAMGYALVSSMLGIAIEYIQASMKLGRGFEYNDMIADTIGAFTIAICWMIFQNFWLDIGQE